METLKIDRTKLKTYKNYAKENGYTVQRIYQMVNENKLNTTKIDGVIFIVI